MSIYGRMRHYLSRIFHKNPNGLTLEQITEKVINLERISRNAPGLYENKNDVWHVGNAVCKGMMFKEKKEGDFGEPLEALFYLNGRNLKLYNIAEKYYMEHNNVRAPHFVNWVLKNGKYYPRSIKELNRDFDLIVWDDIRWCLYRQLSRYAEENQMTITEYLRMYALGISRIKATGFNRGYNEDKIPYENLNLEMIWPRD
ncbi:MAG: hypothetical protein QT11_C0001G0012 [archaeon GW2011_AR20]|nr:MAG: hypothetical protein QT11_C0001G0012 [archaeon GW2011_AR20]MBS3160078.1 hypothetical protein [Candidatus Woesearchaeota archaeon]